MTNLLIIGNGFDLTCGLKSSYKDFFKTKYFSFNIEQFNKEFSDLISIHDYITYNETKKFPKIINKKKDMDQNLLDYYKDRDELINATFTNKNFTFWDYNFLYKVNKNENEEWLWKDVETEIQNVLQVTTTDEFWNIINIDDENSEMIDFESINFEDYTKELLTNYINSVKFRNYGDPFLTIEEFLNKHKDEYDNIYEFLLSELKEFEKSFSNYLADEVSNRDDYEAKAKILYNKILGMKAAIKNSTNYVLSFNYTNPFSNILGYGILRHNKAYINNVHGNLQSDEIIFGIDDFDNLKEEMNIFTKTNRIMGLNEKEKKTIPSKKHLNEIFFFGHSLSEADYSYFLSLFDYYEIYNSNVRLSFVYNKYNKSAKKNQQESIKKLMTKYGETFDNKSKGKNLMHKLTLEGRLNIREI